MQPHNKQPLGSAQAGPFKATQQQGPVCRRALIRLGMLIGAVLCGALFGGVLVYVVLDRPVLEAARVRIQGYEQELVVVRQQLQQAHNALAALEGRLVVEESTRRGLETALLAQQQELGRAREGLAFYEQLMPPGPKAAVAIRALDIDRVGPHLRYRLLLMRSGSNAKPFQGSLQFLAKGQIDGVEVTVPLTPEVVTTGQSDASKVSEAADELIAVEFLDFQRDSGLLALPAGFEPDSVTVNVLEGRTLRTSRSMSLTPGQ